MPHHAEPPRCREGALSAELVTHTSLICVRLRALVCLFACVFVLVHARLEIDIMSRRHKAYQKIFWHYQGSVKVHIRSAMMGNLPDNATDFCPQISCACMLMRVCARSYVRVRVRVFVLIDRHYKTLYIPET